MNADLTACIDGKIQSSLMFYKIGSQSLAMYYEWDDHRGWIKPKPLEAKDLLALAIKTESAGGEFLPDNMLSYTSELDHTWWVKAKRRRINVKGSKRKVFSYPAMVFSLKGGSLHVGCLKRNHRPRPETKLYSIFYNMDVHGTRCAFCNTETPKEVGIRVIPQWEKSFFESYYNALPDINKWKPVGSVGELCIK